LEKFAAMPDDRRAPADHRRPRAGAHSLYRARTRAHPLAEETQTGAARSTAAQDHRGARVAYTAVVPTFGGRPKSCLRSSMIETQNHPCAAPTVSAIRAPRLPRALG